MAITTLAQLQDTIPTVISKARYTEIFNFPMAALVQNIPKKGKGSTVNVPYWGLLTASTLTEGVDMASSETLEDTNVQVTLNEVGAKVILTDNLIEDDQEEVRGVAGTLLGNALGLKRDQDLLALFDNGTTSIPGTGSPLTMGVIAAARALLQGNATSAGGPCPGPYTAVLHPYVTLDLVDVITPVLPATDYPGYAGGGLGDEILRQYVIGRLFGMKIVEDGNMTIDSTPNTKGGVIGPPSIILATAREWNVEPERDASLRAWELNCVGRYGVANYLNGWTVELYSDAATPA
jgi:N4-gp56 family major capsid protein